MVSLQHRITILRLWAYNNATFALRHFWPKTETTTLETSTNGTKRVDETSSNKKSQQNPLLKHRTTYFNQKSVLPIVSFNSAPYFFNWRQLPHSTWRHTIHFGAKNNKLIGTLIQMQDAPKTPHPTRGQASTFIVPCVAFFKPAFQNSKKNNDAVWER